MFEPNALRALLMATVAGMSTLLGALIVLFTKGKNEKLVSMSLGFAAGVMISVTFSDLLPNATAALQTYSGEKAGALLGIVFLVLGILLAAALDKLVPHQAFDKTSGGKPHNDLYRVGFVSMLAIGLHNFPEGIATFMAGFEDAGLGLSIAVAIAMHNIPEGITVALPIYFSTNSRKKAIKYTFISGFAEPLGALLAFRVLRPFIKDMLMGAIFGIVSGIMLYIAIEELIPSSRQYGHDRHALIATFSGLCMMMLTHVL